MLYVSSYCECMDIPSINGTNEIFNLMTFFSFIGTGCNHESAQTLIGKEFLTSAPQVIQNENFLVQWPPEIICTPRVQTLDMEGAYHQHQSFHHTSKG